MDARPSSISASAAQPWGIANPWFALAVLFVGQMLAVGTIAYGFGLLSKPIGDEFALARGDLNLGMMTLIVGMGVFSPLIGRALDRLPSGLVVTGGAILFSIGCGIIAVAPSLSVMLAAAFFLVASGGAALGPLTGSTLISRAFQENRGRALGLISVSSSVGGMLWLPAMAGLIGSYGWRAAVGITGLIALLAVGSLGWLIRIAPPGAPSPRADSDAAPSRRTAGACLRSLDFWAITLAVGLAMAVDQALLVSLIPYGTDQGFTLQSATLVVSVISGMAIAGKIAIGAMADRVDPRWLFITILVLTAAFFLQLTLSPSYPVLIGSAVVVGIGFGGTMPLWATFIANRFGTASFGSIMGLMVPLQIPLNIAALRYVGEAYDQAGTYDTAFLVFLVILLLAALIILPVRRRAGD